MSTRHLQGETVPALSIFKDLNCSIRTMVLRLVVDWITHQIQRTTIPGICPRALLGLQTAQLRSKTSIDGSLSVSPTARMDLEQRSVRHKLSSPHGPVAMHLMRFTRGMKLLGRSLWANRPRWERTSTDGNGKKF